MIPPQRVIVKSAKPRLRPKPHCVVCGAELRGDHCLGDLVCDCHPTGGGDPRCAAPTTMTLTAEERLLVMLYRAAPEPLNVYRAFGCDSSTTNRSAFRDMARRLTASGLVAVRGHKRIGYKLATQGAGVSGSVVPR